MKDGRLIDRRAKPEMRAWCLSHTGWFTSVAVQKSASFQPRVRNADF